MYHRFRDIDFSLIPEIMRLIAILAFVGVFEMSFFALLVDGVDGVRPLLRIDCMAFARKYPYVIESTLHGILAHALGAVLIARTLQQSVSADAGYVENAWQRLCTRFPRAWAYVKLAIAFAASTYGVLQTIYGFKTLK